jgi:hypothetical protein
MRGIWGFCVLLSLLGCTPATNPTTSVSSGGKINSFQVSLVSSSISTATVLVNFDISVPASQKFEANLVIKAPNVKEPMVVAFSDRFADIAQVKMIGWKDNTLLGQIEMKSGQVFSGTSATIPQLFQAPETTYEFELFIRPSGTGIATALEKRSITIK